MLEEIKALYIVALTTRFKIEDWVDISTIKITLYNTTFTPNKIYNFLNENNIKY